MLGFRLFKEMAAGDGLGADPVVQGTATLANLKVDFNPAAIRVPATIADLLPIAWNDDALWGRGGSGNGAEVTVTAASSDTPEDVATWIDAETATLVSSTGEGVTNWVPTAAMLYRLDLRQGGQSVASGYFNLKDCPELESTIRIDSFTASLSQSEFPCNGYPHEPTVTVVDGDNNELEPGTDYVVIYSQNINAGGHRDDLRRRPIRVSSPEPSPSSGFRLLKANGTDGTARVDTRPPDGPIRSHLARALPLAWNDTAARAAATPMTNAVKVTCLAIVRPARRFRTPTRDTR